MKEIIPHILTFLGGGGMTLAVLILTRHWTVKDRAEAKEDKTEDNTEAIAKIIQNQNDNALVLEKLTRALKVSMAYDLNCIAHACIHAQKIPLETKKTFVEMHAAYEDLPSKNGLVMDTIVHEVNKLEVVTE